jgi:hypothetical protein
VRAGAAAWVQPEKWYALSAHSAQVASLTPSSLRPSLPPPCSFRCSYNDCEDAEGSALPPPPLQRPARAAESRGVRAGAQAASPVAEAREQATRPLLPPPPSQHPYSLPPARINKFSDVRCPAPPRDELRRRARLVLRRAHLILRRARHPTSGLAEPAPHRRAARAEAAAAPGAARARAAPAGPALRGGEPRPAPPCPAPPCPAPPRPCPSPCRSHCCCCPRHTLRPGARCILLRRHGRALHPFMASYHPP